MKPGAPTGHGRKPDVLTTALVALCAMGLTAPAHALVVFIDQFTVTRGTTTIFDDPFSDGVPPPGAPSFSNGNAASYSVSGAGGVGPEVNGKLRLDTSNGALSANAVGTVVRDVSSRLLTNVDPTNLNAGLKPNVAFSVAGLFDLPALMSERSNFHIGLRERTQASIAALGLAQLRVARGIGAPFIDFRYQDFVADSVTTISSVPLDLSGAPDQIRLLLAYAPSAAVTASFEFFKAGLSLGAPTAMAGMSDLFVNSEVVIAQFGAAETVIPLPAAAWLLGAGLLALAGAARRRPAAA